MTGYKLMIGKKWKKNQKLYEKYLKIKITLLNINIYPYKTQDKFNFLPIFYLYIRPKLKAI